VWWVVFNNRPAVGGCGADDLSQSGGAGVGLYAARFRDRLSDTGNVTAHLEAGAVPSGVDVEEGDGRNRNGFRAEVHLVVRSHGLTLQGA